MRVTVSDLEVRWGARVVLAGVSASFEAPGRVSIMGPSGAGKSTLLAVIAGQVAPTSGSIGIESEGDGRAEWIVQSSPLLAARTALANVALGPLSRGMAPGRAGARSRRVMADLGLGHLVDMPVHTLSGGERQRVAVSRAVASGAGLVLADEPTASLDHAAKRSVIEALARVSGHGTLLIVATHDPEVSAACDRVFRLVEGRLVEEEP
jgi:ABC-type lipoprotein export system ATPase subunit